MVFRLGYFVTFVEKDIEQSNQYSVQGEQTITTLLEPQLQTAGEEIAFTAQPKIKSQSQIFRYGRSIFCLPHRPKFSDFFE